MIPITYYMTHYTEVINIIFNCFDVLMARRQMYVCAVVQVDLMEVRGKECLAAQPLFNEKEREEKTRYPSMR